MAKQYRIFSLNTSCFTMKLLLVLQRCAFNQCHMTFEQFDEPLYIYTMTYHPATDVQRRQSESTVAISTEMKKQDYTDTCTLYYFSDLCLSRVVTVGIFHQLISYIQTAVYIDAGDQSSCMVLSYFTGDSISVSYI